MTNEQTKQAEIGGYVSMLLRNHFGKGPTSVYVIIRPPFLAVHLRGFLAPIEKMLLKRNERNRILKTRDLLMLDLREEIMEELKKIAGLDIKELYADWDLEKETGLLIGGLNAIGQEETNEWPEGVDKEEFTARIKTASGNVQKIPECIETYWLNDRTVLVRRSGILVALEKELIKNGLEEELRLAKRPLENKSLQAVQLEAVLKRRTAETFLAWNFETDLGYTVFILEPHK
ncbi:Na-translocating system protein MpsC family protein [Planococcus sp. YIM B11945]|uniref:Na-translocating system protein MpsC family protein n=1 Tax=Planococcus sp. YIM B11945 TaxID=3435410 RepID=UPI003D7F048B